MTNLAQIRERDKQTADVITEKGYGPCVPALVDRRELLRRLDAALTWALSGHTQYDCRPSRCVCGRDALIKELTK